MNVTPYTLDSLRKLVRDLQAENKELKALLDKSGIPYAKSNVFEESGTAAEEYDIDQGGRIQPQYIDQNLAVRFFSMFWGREDVFAKRARNGNYYPQCENRWNAVCPAQAGGRLKCSECEYTKWQPLGPDLILRHLLGYKEDGSDVIGVYPLLPDGKCRFLVFDFDNHEKGAEKNDFANEDEEWHDEVDALRLICQQNGIDALVFTAGIGENDHELRQNVCRDMDFFGIAIDEEKNASLPRGSEADISAPGARVHTMVIPTDEEYMIAQDTARLAGA